MQGSSQSSAAHHHLHDRSFVLFRAASARLIAVKPTTNTFKSRCVTRPLTDLSPGWLLSWISTLFHANRPGRTCATESGCSPRPFGSNESLRSSVGRTPHGNDCSNALREDASTINSLATHTATQQLARDRIPDTTERLAHAVPTTTPNCFQLGSRDVAGKLGNTRSSCQTTASRKERTFVAKGDYCNYGDTA